MKRKIAILLVCSMVLNLFQTTFATGLDIDNMSDLLKEKSTINYSQENNTTIEETTQYINLSNESVKSGDTNNDNTIQIDNNVVEEENAISEEDKSILSNVEFDENGDYYDVPEEIIDEVLEDSNDSLIEQDNETSVVENNENETIVEVDVVDENTTNETVDGTTENITNETVIDDISTDSEIVDSENINYDEFIEEDIATVSITTISDIKNETKQFGDVTNWTIDSVRFGTDGKLVFEISYPKNDPNYQGEWFGIDLHDPYVKRIQDQGPFNSTEIRGDLGYVEMNADATKKTYDDSLGKLTYEIDYKTYYQPIEDNCTNKTFEKFLKYYGGLDLYYTKIMLYANSSQHQRTYSNINCCTIGQDKIHVWKSGWNKVWELADWGVSGADDWSDPINDTKDLKRIHFVSKSFAENMLTLWLDGTQHKFEKYYNSSLGLMAISDIHTTSNQMWEEVWMVINDDEQIVFDGENSANLFKNTKIHYVSWDTITKGTYEGQSHTKRDDIFDCSNLTTMEGWFENVALDEDEEKAEGAEWIPSRLDFFTILDLSNVVSMKNMFKNAHDVNTSGTQDSKYSNPSVDLYTLTEKLNTPNLTDVSGMFEGATFNCGYKLPQVEQDSEDYLDLDKGQFNALLTHLDLSNVTTMEKMFKDVKGFPCTIKSSSMTQEYVRLDLTKFDNIKVTNMSQMFSSPHLKRVFINEDIWSTASVTTYNDIFTNATSLIGENDSMLNDPYITNDIVSARRDTYYTPGLLTDYRWKDPQYSLKKVYFPTEVKTEAGNIDHGIAEPVEFKPAYKQGYVTLGSEQPLRYLQGFKTGETVKAYNQYNILTWPVAGDTVYHYDKNTWSGYYTRNVSGAYDRAAVYIKRENPDGIEVQINSDNEFTNFVVKDVPSSVNREINYIKSIFLKADLTATFKSDHCLDDDIVRYYDPGYPVEMVNNFVVDQVYEDNGTYYIFKGWIKEGETTYYTPKLETTDVVFNADWEAAAVVTVTFDDPKGYFNDFDDQTFLPGNKATRPENPVDDYIHKDTGSNQYNYQFEYWYEGNNTNVPFDFNSPVNSDINLHIKWKQIIKKYTVKYESDHLGPFADEEIEYNHYMVDNTNLKRDNIYKDGGSYYKFLAWSVPGIYGNTYDLTSVKVTSDITVTAIWGEEISASDIYEVHFISDIGEYVFDELVYVDKINPDEDYYDPYFDSYPYNSWLRDNNYVPTKPVHGAYTEHQNKRYEFDKWVEVDSNGNIQYKPQNPDDVGILEPEPYFVDNWRNKNATYKAKWNKNDNIKKVTYVSAHGNLNPTSRLVESGYTLHYYDDEYAYESEKNADNWYEPKSPRIGDRVVEGDKTYLLQYWKNGENRVYSDITVDTDITLTAYWKELQTYKVSFTNTKGIVIATQSIQEGGYATQPTNMPSSLVIDDVLYEFDSWYYEYDWNTFYFYSTQINQDYVLTAKWKSKVNVSWTSQYNSGYLPQTTKYDLDNDGGKVIQELNNDNFKKNVSVYNDGTNDYMFKYWYTTSSNIPYDFNKKIYKNTTFKAYWKKITFVTLTYLSSNERLYSSNIIYVSASNKTNKQKVVSGDSITSYFPYQPNLNDERNDNGIYYKFRGYTYEDENGNEQFIQNGNTERAFYKDTTFTTVWEKRKAAKFKSDIGNISISDQTWYATELSAGKILNKPTNFDGYTATNPYRDTTNQKAYKFEYWMATDSDAPFDFTKPVYDDCVIKASWSEVEFFYSVTANVYHYSYGNKHAFEDLIDSQKSKTWKVKPNEIFDLTQFKLYSAYKILMPNQSYSYYAELAEIKYNNQDGTGIYTDNITITNDTTLCLYLIGVEASTYTATFKSDVIVADQEFKFLSYVPKPAEPVAGNIYEDQSTHNRYKFLYWYEEGDDTKKPITFNPRIYKYTNVTYIAKWLLLKNITIEFKDDYKTPPIATMFEAGNKLEKPTTHTDGEPDIEHNGRKYKFLYWYASGSDVEYDFDKDFEDDTILVAKYLDVTPLNVDFVVVHGTNPDTQVIINDNFASTPSYPTENYEYKQINDQNIVVKAYKFKYWYSTDSNVAFDFSKTKIKNHTTLTASWSDIPLYKVEYKDDDNYLVNDMIASRSMPQDVLGILEDKTISTPTEINIDDIVKIAVGQYYKFKGWENVADNTIFDYNTKINTDYILNAKWEIYDGIEVTFDKGGHFADKTIPNQTVYPDVNIVEPTELSNGDIDVATESDGHRHTWTFEYWYATDSSMPYDFTKDPTEDITLHAKYTDTKYDRITFETGGIIPTPSEIQIKDGEKFNEPTEPQKNKEYDHDNRKYKIVHWYSTDSNTPYDFDLPVEDHIVLKIKWLDVTPWNVDFVVVHGTNPDRQVIINDNFASTPSYPVDEYIFEEKNAQNITVKAYKFKYWYETDENIPFDFSNTKILDHKTLTATWSNIPLYKVEYKDDDNYLVNDMIASRSMPQNVLGILEDKTISTPTEINIDDIVKKAVGEYYKFKGWENVADNTIFDYNTKINSDYVLNAKWEAYDGIEVTFDKGGHFADKTIPNQTVYPDVNIVEPTEISNGDIDVATESDGHRHTWTFEYWYATDSSMPYDFTKDPTEDITLHAKYTDTKYDRITFETGGIIPTPSEIQIKDGEKLDEPTEPQKNKEYDHDNRKYKIVHWYSTDSNTPYDFDLPVEDHIVLKIKWLDVTPWNVDFVVVHGTNPDRQIIINDNFASTPSYPVDEYIFEEKNAQNITVKAYKFKYWYETDENIPFDFSNTKILDHKTLTATWSNIPIFKVEYTDTDNYLVNDILTTRQIPSKIEGILKDETISTPTEINVDDIVKIAVGQYYKFKGWENVADNTIFDYNTKINSDYVLNAKWEVFNGAVVTFDKGGHFADKTISNQTVYPDVNIVEPTEIRNGDIDIATESDGHRHTWTFEYWYATDSSMPYDFTKNPIDDITLHAKYTDTKYDKITFETGGIIPTPSEIQIKDGEKFDEPTEPQKNKEYDHDNRKYKIVHWYSTDSNTPYDFDLPVEDHIVLKIKWLDVTPLNVDFVVVHGTNPDRQVVINDNSATKPSYPVDEYVFEEKNAQNITIKAYKFKYWYETDENVPFDFSNTKILDHKTLTATWSNIPIFKVEYTDTDNYLVNDILTTRQMPSKIEGILKDETISTPTEINVDDIVKIAVGQYYKFKGWENVADNTIFDYNTKINSDYVLNAKWEVFNGAVVTFDKEGHFADKTIPNQTVYPDAPITEPTEIRNGDIDVATESDGHRHTWTFEYWYATDSNMPYDFTKNPIEDITLHAKYTDTKYDKITFETGGIIPTPSEIQIKDGEKLNEPTEPQKNKEYDHDNRKYKIVHWYSTDSNTPFDFDKPIDNHIVLKIKWLDVTPWNVDFVVVHGTNPDRQVVINDNFATKPSYPADEYVFEEKNAQNITVKAYKFKYWYETDENTPFDFTNTKILDHKTLKATWSNIPLYVIEYKDDDGYLTNDKIKTRTLPKKLEGVKSGDKISEPTEIVKDEVVKIADGQYYKFKGWKNVADNTIFDYNTAINLDLVLNATWEVFNGAEVTFNIGTHFTSKTIPNQTVYPDIDLKEPTEIKKGDTETTTESDGHKHIWTFEYWYATDSNMPYDFTKNPTNDITLNAKYKDTRINNITFDTEGKYTQPSDQEVPTGNKITRPTGPKDKEELIIDDDNKEVFDYWYDTDINTPYDFNQPVNGDIQLKIKWKKCIRVQYISQYVTPNKKQEFVEIGKTVVAPRTPAVNYKKTNTDKKIYQMKHWYITDETVPFDFTTPISTPTTLTAKWEYVGDDIRNSNSGSSGGSGGGGSSNGGFTSTIEQGKGKTETQIENFLKDGDITKVTDPDINKDELNNLRHLLSGGKLSGDYLKYNWHKIAQRVWYYSDNNGSLKRGWHDDPDDTQKYYFYPSTGIMAVSWAKINNDYYYFSWDPESNNWFYNGSEWTTRNYNDKSIGSMYVNEWTPDGYFVDEYGRYVSTINKEMYNLLSDNQYTDNIYGKRPFIIALSNMFSNNHIQNIHVVSPDDNWIKIRDAVWYFEDKNKEVYKGWMIDPSDNKIYHLDEEDGIMSIGWTKLNGQWYYFHPEKTFVWYYDVNAKKWKPKQQDQKELGSMYQDEWTPDGYYVNEKGIYVEGVEKH